ncbi:right-handed parallel beta-helix repeat-containing protein [Halorubrum sp. CSM-61]|uniref:right-handed parallel beta-helix repeat-containing protein n=1 Tax=Halorubrum sp. CSM-61 TaxID=2485838 RepID=UPI0019D151DF|nr:right-handed parallel beta-helix repeat-containing protein [Halorubrum sp. CSM-61]
MPREANPPDDAQDGYSRRKFLQRGVGGGFAFAGIGGVRTGTVGDYQLPKTIAEPTTVDESGRYLLEDDVSAAGEGIEIAASNVTIDGRGHRIEGDGERTGIKVRDGARGVTVENLTVRNFRRGVDVRWGASLTLDSVTVEGNAAAGVRSEGGAEIACADSAVRGNGGVGIAVDDGRVSIRDCEIRENAGRALVVESGARATTVVEDSVVADNGGGVLLPTTAGSSVERTLIETNDGPGVETAPVGRSRTEGDDGWAGKTTLVARSPIEATGGSGVERAPPDGPQLDDPVLVRRCDVRDNAGPGVEHTNGFLEVRGCVLAGNEAGYRLRAAAAFEARLRRNVVEGNEAGGAVADAASFPKAVDATCNWWGDETGPSHRDNPLDDPSGQSVSDRVEFLPWSADRPENAGRSEDADPAEDSDSAEDSDPAEDSERSCTGGLETGEGGVGYVSEKSYRRITGADPYGGGCWDGTFYLTDPSDIDPNGYGDSGAIVGEDERLAEGHVIRAEADAVPVTLPTWGGERGDCESVLFVELNQPLSADRAYRIADVHGPSPYREDVDTNGFSETVDAVVRITFEPVEPEASVDGATPLR